MPSLKIKITYLLLGLGLIAGIAVAVLFHRSSKEGSKQTIVPVAELKKSEQKIDSSFQRSMSLVTKKEDTVKKEIVNGKAALAKAKQSQQPYERLLLQWADSTATIDQDSLQQYIEQYIQGDQSKDTLAQTVISSLDNLVDLQQTEIGLRESRYQRLDSVFHFTLDQQEKLQTTNLALEKTLRHRKRNGKLLSFGVLVLSGTAAAILLHK